jgi:hypothetical protein
MDIKYLNRAIKALEIHVKNREANFQKKCQSIDDQQKGWVKTSSKLTKEFAIERKRKF